MEVDTNSPIRSGCERRGGQCRADLRVNQRTPAWRDEEECFAAFSKRTDEVTSEILGILRSNPPRRGGPDLIYGVMPWAGVISELPSIAISGSGIGTVTPNGPMI